MPFFTSIPTLLTSVYNICKQDNTLHRLKFTQDCYSKFLEFEHDRIKDDDSVSTNDSSEMETTNKRALRTELRGKRKWYQVLGKIIGTLNGLYSLYFDSLDPDEEELSIFWSEVARSGSLRYVECTKMNITDGNNFLVWFGTKNVEHIRFYLCEIGNEIGWFLGDKNCNNLNKEITFEKCHFLFTQGNNSVMDFARGLCYINKLKCITFCDCTFTDKETESKFEQIIENILQYSDCGLFFK